MSLKIGETSPFNTLSSGLTAIQEEVVSLTSACCCPSTISSATPGHQTPDCFETVFGTIIGSFSLITDVIWDFMVDLYSYIGSTITCLTGGTIDSAEALAATRFYKINRARISETPRNLSLDAAILSATENAAQGLFC